jgi:hypothetical protein
VNVVGIYINSHAIYILVVDVVSHERLELYFKLIFKKFVVKTINPIKCKKKNDAKNVGVI